MAKLANDIPSSILNLLSSVDYSRITQSQYMEFGKQILKQEGRFLKKRKHPATLINIDVPISQDFCDFINKYQFTSLTKLNINIAMPLIKDWARRNLPLKQEI
jgi:hypothetical protein